MATQNCFLLVIINGCANPADHFRLLTQSPCAQTPDLRRAPGHLPARSGHTHDGCRAWALHPRQAHRALRPAAPHLLPLGDRAGAV